MCDCLAIPFLKFDATKYYDLIDRQAIKVTEFFATKHARHWTTKNDSSTRFTLKYLFPQFPCHSQVVEKCDLVMAATAAVCWVDLYARKLILSIIVQVFFET